MSSHCSRSLYARKILEIHPCATHSGLFLEPTRNIPRLCRGRIRSGQQRCLVSNAAGYTLSQKTHCNPSIPGEWKDFDFHGSKRRTGKRRFSASGGIANEKASVHITKTNQDKNTATIATPYDPESKETTSLIDDLLIRTRALMDLHDDAHDNPPDDSNCNNSSSTSSAHHVIAYSGGIDSSVAALLIQGVLGTPVLKSQSYSSERATAVLGLSPAVPHDQRVLAETVAKEIGIAFETLATTEGSDDVYVANDGRACLACKTHLYDNLESIATRYASSSSTILYNGTNAEDTLDPTRLGLIAASEFSVRSPLLKLPKTTIRRVGKHFGLSNWNYAAAPCLRSRLAVGVHATSFALKNVELAEAFVRTQLEWDPQKALRVRILSRKRARIEIEVDATLGVQDVRDLLEAPGSSWKSYLQDELGFASVDVQEFRTGSVAPRIVAPSSIDDDNGDETSNTTASGAVHTIAVPAANTTRKLRRR